MLGTHLSDQRLTFSPFLTDQVMASVQSCQPLMTFFPIIEMSCFVLAFLLMYFALSTLTQMLEGLCMNLQARLISMESFLMLAFWMPSLPSFFVRVFVSQEIRCIFFLSSVDPHRKSLWILSMCLRVCLGILMNCIMWLGVLFRELLVRMVLPAIFKNLVFQPASLVLRLSRMNWKSL